MPKAGRCSAAVIAASGTSVPNTKKQTHNRNGNTASRQKKYLIRTSVPEEAWEEFGRDINDTDWNIWIDELFAKSHENTPIQDPMLASVPANADVTALHTFQKRYKLTLTLIYVSATAAFFIGVVFGIFIRGFYIQPESSMHRGTYGNEMNEIIGTLYYINENGDRLPDVDVAIICLRKDCLPSPLLSFQGLRPGDAVNHGNVQMIREMGGMYGSAEINGSFALPYQEGAQYLIIMISANQTRRDSTIKPRDMQELNRYFYDPGHLSEYCLNIYEFAGASGKNHLQHVFE